MAQGSPVRPSPLKTKGVPPAIEPTVGETLRTDGSYMMIGAVIGFATPCEADRSISLCSPATPAAILQLITCALELVVTFSVLISVVLSWFCKVTTEVAAVPTSMLAASSVMLAHTATSPKEMERSLSQEELLLLY